MSRLRTVLAVGATLLGTVGLPAVTTSGAHAAAETLYVNNAAKAACSDGGTGTQARPFCTVAAAAAAVQPGQTVEIVKGTYVEPGLTITRSGRADAPITFRGVLSWEHESGSDAWIGSIDQRGDGITVRGASHVKFEDLFLYTADGKPGVLVDGADDISFMNLDMLGGTGVHIANGSDRVRFGRSTLSVDQGPGFTVDGGSTGTVVTTNSVWPKAGDKTGVLVKDAPNTVVVSNTVAGSCGSPGIVLDGASGGATVENNAVNAWPFGGGPCTGVPAGTGVVVAAGATAGTVVDYNVVDPRNGGTPYSWAGTGYADQPSFTAAAGQGAHDFVAPTSQLSYGPDTPVSKLTDSADENAPGMLATDLGGYSPVDDPTVPNTGTGSGIRDRGVGENVSVGSAFTPAGPVRLLDTREAIGVPQAQAVPAFGQVDLQVAGTAGVPAVGVAAVTMTVTVTEPEQDGHLRVYPHGTQRPASSVLNWVAGRTVPNQVTVPVKDGKVSFYNHSGGTVHLIADLAGYYSPKGDLFHPQDPTRVLDTRAPIGVPQAQAVPAFGTLELPVAGVAGIPASGVTAVTMNVTVTEPEQEGHLTVYPYGAPAPGASNLNWTAGRTVANLVTVPVKDGKVSFYNHSGGTVHLVADLAGHYAAEGRLGYYPSGPTRMMDTRIPFSTDRYHSRPAGAVPAGGTLSVFVGYDGTRRRAATTMNVTVTEPGAEGHLTVYRSGGTVPEVSNLNFGVGETVANQVVVPLTGEWVSFRNASDAPIHLVVDVFGTDSY
ncbi:right-handed parallel beta-helix repeat-containing protein [Kitasatospora purpeofusca]|uniref:right-handed parallel beta-helix repeat-containing protein n=1 Tax=Kitasatospora purpeofusca TaxID=67352 RepID=UPI0036EF62B0